MANPDNINALVFNSFLHSQGDVDAHGQILMHLERQELGNYEGFVSVIENMEDQLGRYVGSSRHGPKIFVAQTSVPNTANRLRLYQADNGLTRYGLFCKIILSDCRFTDKGRPSRPIYGGRKSPSHLALFGLLGETTGFEAYDKMYADIVRVYKSATRKELCAHAANIAVRNHIANNPQDEDRLISYISDLPGLGSSDIID